MTNTTEKDHKEVHTSNFDRRSNLSPSTINDTEVSVQDPGAGGDTYSIHINKTDIINDSQLTTTETLDYSQSTATETTTNLYKMKALAPGDGRSSPEKIEFKLHKKSKRPLKCSSLKVNSRIRKSPSKIHHNCSSCRIGKNYKKQKKKKKCDKRNKEKWEENVNEIPFVKRLCNSLSKMVSRTPEKSPMEFNNKFQKSKIPQRDNNDEARENEYHSSFSKMNSKSIDRMDIYYFDHGNSAYFRTTDCPPIIISEILAQQTTFYATRFWAEIFGAIHIGVTFFITFFLQAYRFLLHSIFRPIIIGILQITSDYFIKPILTIVFNGFLQPPLILFYNIFSSLRDMLEPIAVILDNFLKPISKVLKSIRLVNFNYVNKKHIKKENV